MDRLTTRGATSGSWLRPRVGSEGAARHLQTLRDRWWLVLLAVAASVAAAAGYLQVAPQIYRAEADLLVTPVSGGDATLAGLGLITESTDPTQDISTAARLSRTPAVAAAAARTVGSGADAGDVLADVTVEPIAQSTLVAVEAQAPTAAGAAALANAFATAAVLVRTEQLHEEIDAVLPRLQAQLEQLPAEERVGPGTLGERVSALRALRSSRDPTIRVATRAEVPTAPASPRPRLTLAAGVIGGLILGLGAAFALQALDPRLRRDEQLRELFRLPLLARIPQVGPGGARRLGRLLRHLVPGPERGAHGPLTPDRLTPTAIEAYRTLRATLSVTIDDDHRSFLVTSAAPGEGKTTTALNLAASLAHLGDEVILIEGDMRRPTIGAAIGVRPALGIGSVLIQRAELRDALVSVPQLGDNLRFLLAEPAASVLADRLALPTAAALVAEAEALADWVVIDSPPLTEVVDALPLARKVGGVVIVARLRVSRLNRLVDLGEVLAQGGVTPAGFAVVGEANAPDTGVYSEVGPEPVGRSARVPVRAA